MARTSKLLLGISVLGLTAALVPVALYSYERLAEVDTEAMLDVSVSIKTTSHVRIDAVGDSVWESGTGSGFLVSAENCEVWTNHHVVEDAAIIEVFPRRWKGTVGIPATVINSTQRSDLALIKLQYCDGIPEAILGTSATARQGDEAYAVGNPLGKNPDSISRGIVSHTNRILRGTTPYLQTDAAITLGNSGGALFNRDGEVIGMNSAIASVGNANTGIGYALPIDLAKRVTNQLRNGPPSWGDAGLSKMVSGLTPEQAAIFKVPEGNGGIIVTAELKEGPSAGKLQAHDVIYKIDGASVSDPDEALRLISEYDPGTSVDFHLIRNGKQDVVSIELSEGWTSGESHAADYYDGLLGMTVEMWTGEDGEKAQFTSPVITRVQSLGPAHRAHIASSQKTFVRAGGAMYPYLLDVKMVTGIVYDGAYYAIEDVETLNGYAAMAYAAESPLLLELEIWARPNQAPVQSELEQVSKEFFMVSPTVTTAEAPKSESEDSQQQASYDDNSVTQSHYQPL